MKKIVIDGASLNDRERAHDMLAQTFCFPDYYGRNLDALADCLGDIGERTEVEVEGAGPFGEYGERVRRVLCESAKENANIVLSFPDEEAEKLAAPFFETTQPPVLKSYPSKQKKEMAVLRIIARVFEPGREYTEREVNALLSGVHEDYVTLRRQLVDFGFLERERDGSAYRLRARG